MWDIVFFHYLVSCLMWFATEYCWGHLVSSHSTNRLMFNSSLIMCRWLMRTSSGYAVYCNLFTWTGDLYNFHLQKQLSKPGARFTNGFSIAIQIRWKFLFILTSIVIQWSLQNFVYGTTDVLSWHLQTFVAIWWRATELWQGEVSIEFELRAKKR